MCWQVYAHSGKEGIILVSLPLIKFSRGRRDTWLARVSNDSADINAVHVHMGNEATCAVSGMAKNKWPVGQFFAATFFYSRSEPRGYELQLRFDQGSGEVSAVPLTGMPLCFCQGFACQRENWFHSGAFA